MHGQSIIYLVNYLEIMAILSSLFLAVHFDKCKLLQNEGAKSSPGSHLIWNINEHGWIIQRSYKPFQFSLYVVKVSTSISQQRCERHGKLFGIQIFGTLYLVFGILHLVFCIILTSVSQQRCWCQGNLCNNPSNDSFVFSHTTTTTRATTARTTVRVADVTQEVAQTTERKTTRKTSNSKTPRSNGNSKKGNTDLQLSLSWWIQQFFNAQDPKPYWESRNENSEAEKNQAGEKVSLLFLQKLWRDFFCNASALGAPVSAVTNSQSVTLQKFR